MIINEEYVNKALGINCKISFLCSNIGLLDSNRGKTISYVSSEKYIGIVNNNNNINVVFTTSDLAGKIDKVVIECDDPVWSFWTLYNHYAKKVIGDKQIETVIHPTASIHPTSYVAKNNVIIGKNSLIEPNVTIHADVNIGNNCIIRSGSVIGFDGFEHKRTYSGIISVVHDGAVIISNNVEIGSLNSIAKGFSWKDTYIGYETKTDSLVHIAHGVTIGRRCLLTRANA